jgi:hypothetical protein
MKTLKLILMLFALSFSINSQGQILKRLGRSADRAAERALEKKVDEKATKETEKAFDSTFNKTKTNKEAQNHPSIRSSSSSPASSYSFAHKYVMQIQSDKYNSTINYFLNNSEEYIGFSMDLKSKNTNVFSVMDMSKNMMVMFMDNNNQKTQMAMDLDFDTMTEDANDDQQVKITTTGNTKSLLGYTCHEYNVNGEDYHGNVWVTQDAGVSFSKAFYKAKSKKGLNQSWMSKINGLVMEMNITNTSKRKSQTIIMTCIALEKNKLTINSSDYKKMM